MPGADGRFTISATDKTKAAFRSVNKRLKNLTSSVFDFRGAIAGTIGTVGLGALVKQSIDAGAKIHDLSIRLNASTEALSQYKHVAEVTGVSFETLTLGLQRMTRRISEAAQGTGEAVGALKELGLTAEDLNNLKPEQQFERIADRINSMTNEADKVRVAMKLFDTDGVALIQTMKGGSAAIRGLRDEADSLGATLSGAQGQKLKDAQVATEHMKTAMNGLAVELAVNVSPALTGFFGLISRNIRPAIAGFKDLRLELINMSIPLQEILLARDKLDQSAADFVGPKMAQILSGGQFDKDRVRQREEFLNHLKTERDLLVRDIADLNSQPLVIPITGGAEGAAGGGGGRELDAKKQKALASFLQLQQSTLSEETLLAESFARRAEIIQNAQDENLINGELANGLILAQQGELMNGIAEIQQKGLNDSQRMWQSSWQGKAKILGGVMDSISQLMMTGGKKQFEIGKKLALANAVVSMAASINNARSVPPYPLGVALAVQAAAAGLVQIKAIQSQKFGGGASSSSGSSGTGASPVFQANPVTGLPSQGNQQQNSAPSTVQIIFQGDVNGWDNFIQEKVIDGIKDAVDNRDVVLISPGSRNALDLTP